MLFIALSVIVAVCNVILKEGIRRIISDNIFFVKSIKGIMSTFLQSSSGNITSSVIKFKQGDKNHCFDIIDKNVIIYGSVGSHDHGSSKVKLKNIVDYQWEAKDYPGHLIAVHLDGKHIAYAIKVNKSSEGMVRVVNAYSGQRALIKGMSGEVLDLQFAHLENDQILGCIDEKTLYIHKIDMLDGNLICTTILRIDDPIKNYQPKYDKISWCPFVQTTITDENDDTVDVSQFVVWSRGGTFQCFNVNSIIAVNGIGKHDTENLTAGYLKWENNSLVITWISLSPDASTLGVGSDDGYIRFYQMYLHEKEPRCLHQWKPHNGKIISSFFFLDNLTVPQTDAYWKYALTGADGNSEFKIWDCGIWSCLQTITFAPHLGKKSSFIAELDRTSSYLVLTNRETRGLYVLQIAKQSEINDDSLDADDAHNQNDENSNDLSELNESQLNKKIYAFIKSVSEFPLSSSVLSFCIVDAAVRKYKCGLNDENYLIDELDDYDDENNAIFCVVVRLFIVQPKSVQECHILYQPSLTEQCDIKSSMSNESLVEGFEDYLTDISGSSSTKINHHHQNSSSSSSSSTQEKNIVNENTSSLLLEKKRSSISPINITSTTIDKVHKSNSQSPIIQNINTSSSHKTTNSSSQLNLMIPEAFSASSSTGSGGGGGSVNKNINDNDKKPPECVSSEVLSTILMLASVTGSSTGANKAENVSLLNFVNNKVIEDQEKRKMKQQQKKSFSIIENTNSQQQQQQGNTDILASGGSSPSREVQEIMSHGCKTYYNDDNKQMKNEKIKQQNSTTAAVATATATATTTTNWPKVPDVRNVTKHSTEIQNSSNMIVSSASLEINDLSLRINQLIDVIQMQSSQINSLKNDIIELKKMKTDNRFIIGNPDTKNLTTDFSQNNSNDNLLKIEKNLTKILEQYLIRYEEEHKQKMKEFISAKNVQSQEIRDGILHYFNQYMFNEFIDKITNILITEIQRNVVPVIIDKIDVIKQQIQSEVSQKLSITDNVLRENIAQVCKSKSIIDAFGNSVLLGVKSGLQSTYIESMSSTLIPAYERSSQEMFKQLHETFSRGIQEVMKQFDSYISQLQPVEAGTDEILERLGDIQKQFDQTISKNRNNTEVTIEMKKDLKTMESNMIRNLSELIQNEIKKSFESQAASLEDSVLSVVRSQAHTPAPMVYDVQDQIKLLLCQNQINKAFHQALIANDLSLVEYTLEKADYKSVFNPCALEQTVLLSLIQQISADMNNHSELKQRYLSDAILNLNLNDPITKEHSPRVLKELYKNCHNFLSNYPKNPLSSNVRMIMMAIQGMGYKVF